MMACCSGVERVNLEIREIMSLIRLDTGWSEDEWHRYLHLVASVINSSPSRVLGGLSPGQVHTGAEPTSPLSLVFLPTRAEFQTVKVTQSQLMEHVQELQAALEARCETIAALKPRAPVRSGGEEGVNFDVGDYVLTASQRGSSLSSKPTQWHGPAVVVSRVGPLRFVVKDIANGREKELHAAHIKRYADKDLYVTQALRDMAARGGEGWLVEDIVDHRLGADGKWRLKVKWEGYKQDDEKDWEPLLGLHKDVPALVNRYVARVVDRTARTAMEQVLRRRSGE